MVNYRVEPTLGSTHSETLDHLNPFLRLTPKVSAGVRNASPGCYRRVWALRAVSR
jgi:hypothetical protein